MLPFSTRRAAYGGEMQLALGNGRKLSKIAAPRSTFRVDTNSYRRHTTLNRLCSSSKMGIASYYNIRESS